MCRGTKSPTHNLPSVFFPTRNAVTLFHDLNRRCTREVVRTGRRRLRAQDFMLRHCLAPACHAAFAVPERRHRRVTTLQSSGSGAWVGNGCREKNFSLTGSSIYIYINDIQVYGSVSIFFTCIQPHVWKHACIQNVLWYPKRVNMLGFQRLSRNPDDLD